MSNTLSLKYIQDEFIPVVESSHATVKTAIKQLGSDGDVGKMLEIQITMASWTMTTEVVSTTVKQCGDAIKGITQKIS